MTNETELNGTKRKLGIIPPEKEPEYVGAHSALTDERCANICAANGPDGAFEPERCENAATHTVVMADGNGVHEIAMCDGCGERDDVDGEGREWSGVIREEFDGRTEFRKRIDELFEGYYDD